jgi:hypothetical protein
MLESRASASGTFFVTLQVGAALETSSRRSTPVRAVYVEKFLFDVSGKAAAGWLCREDNCSDIDGMVFVLRSCCVFRFGENSAGHDEPEAN